MQVFSIAGIQSSTGRFPIESRVLCTKEHCSIQLLISARSCMPQRWARGQGATEGSKQKAAARVEWRKGWTLSQHMVPFHRPRSSRNAAGWIGRLWGQSCSHTTWSSSSASLCSHSGTIQVLRIPSHPPPPDPKNRLKGHSFLASQKQMRPSECHSVKAPTYYLQITQFLDTGRSISPKF